MSVPLPVTDRGALPRVAVYRDVLLAASEGFVWAQASALRRFDAVLVGSRRVAGVPVPADRTILVNDGTRAGRAREAFYKLAGRSARLARRVGSHRPVLVHAHFGPDGVLALPLAERLRVPLVVTYHGFDATASDAAMLASPSRASRRHVQACRQLWRRSALVVAVSEFVARRLVERGLPPTRLRVHYVGVDVEAFAPDPRATREPVVLFVGRLVEKKGCEYLLRAMAGVQRAGGALALVVIGDGPLRQSLEQLARALGVRCRFLGAQPHAAVRDWMRRSLLFSVPSVTAATGDAEGFGLALAEAQACGLPVASFAHGGVPEAVSNGATGLLAPERDWEALATNILAIARDRELWARFSAAGRRRVVERFDLRRQTASLEELYDEALAPRTAREAET